MFNLIPNLIADRMAKRDFSRQSKFSEAQSAKQMAFQERMSGTSYQRAMADMRKAGLNPILAGKMGGASTPSGAMASTPNIDTAGTAQKVLNQATMVAQLRNTGAQTRLTNATSAKVVSDKALVDEKINTERKLQTEKETIIEGNNLKNEMSSFTNAYFTKLGYPPQALITKFENQVGTDFWHHLDRDSKQNIYRKINKGLTNLINKSESVSELSINNVLNNVAKQVKSYLPSNPFKKNSSKSTPNIKPKGESRFTKAWRKRRQEVRKLDTWRR